MPSSRDADAAEADRSVIRLACRALLPLMALGGGGEGGGPALPFLMETVPILLRHASCEEAIQCLHALVCSDRELCAACPAALVRSFLLLPLTQGRRPSLLALVRALIFHDGALIERPRAHVLAALRALPPDQLMRLLPLPAPSEDASLVEPPTSPMGMLRRGATDAASADADDDEVASPAYRVQASALLCECASGNNFDAEALIRRLCPFPSLVSQIVDAGTDEELRYALLRLLVVGYVDAEVRASLLSSRAPFAQPAPPTILSPDCGFWCVHAVVQVRSIALSESSSVTELLEYIRQRLRSAANAISSAIAAAAAIAGSEATSAGAAELAVSPDAAFLASAAMPFLDGFYQRLYRPHEASARLRETSSSLAATLGALVAALAAPAPAMQQVLTPAQQASLQSLRRAGRQSLLLLERRGLGAVISTAGSMDLMLLSPPTTPRNELASPSASAASLLPAETLPGMGDLSSPHAMVLTPRAATASAHNASLLKLTAPHTVQAAGKAGKANVAAARAEAAAEVAAVEEAEAEVDAAVEASVQERWSDLMWELRQNRHVAQLLRVDHEALIRSLRAPNASGGENGVDWLLHVLVRHAARQLQACASAPRSTSDSPSTFDLASGGGVHAFEAAAAGISDEDCVLGRLGDRAHGHRVPAVVQRQGR